LRAATLLGIVLAAAAAPAPAAGPIDPSTPEGAILASRKMNCSLRDGVPVTYWWHGEMYSRVPGERDRKLFGIEGMNIRQCETVTDPERGTGYRLVSRELLLYLDPGTGVPLEKWTNPWTGEEVAVIQTQNDPVSMRNGLFPVGRDGKPFTLEMTVQGNEWWTTGATPLFYLNPLGGDYQDYVGGKYHAVEMFSDFGEVDDLVDPARHTAKVRLSWSRISNWLPWMRMGDRVGILYVVSAGRKLDDWSQMGATMRAYIDAKAPLYREPPPFSDRRPNETSWTYFKRQVEPTPPVPRETP
jgi:hypothetical protein